MEVKTIHEILLNAGLFINSNLIKNLEEYISCKKVKTKEMKILNKNFLSIYYEEPKIIKSIIFEWILQNNNFMREILKELNININLEQEKILLQELRNNININENSITSEKLKEEIKQWWKKCPKTISQILVEIKLNFLSDEEIESLYKYVSKQTKLSIDDLHIFTYNTGKIIKFVQRWTKTLPKNYGAILIYDLEDIGNSYVNLGYDGKEEIKISFLDEFENFLEKTLRMIDYDRSRVKGLFDPLSTNAWKHDFLEYGEIFYFGPLEVPYVVLKWFEELISISKYKRCMMIPTDYDLLERKIAKRKSQIKENSLEILDI